MNSQWYRDQGKLQVPLPGTVCAKNDLGNSYRILFLKIDLRLLHLHKKCIRQCATFLLNKNSYSHCLETEKSLVF